MRQSGQLVSIVFVGVGTGVVVGGRADVVSGKEYVCEALGDGNERETEGSSENDAVAE